MEYKYHEAVCDTPEMITFNNGMDEILTLREVTAELNRIFENEEGQKLSYREGFSDAKIEAEGEIDNLEDMLEAEQSRVLGLIKQLEEAEVDVK